jgi:hypothetical protein
MTGCDILAGPANHFVAASLFGDIQRVVGLFN